MAEWPAFRPGDLLGVLVAHGVDFVVVGGLATVFHGSTRVTQDLDVCHATEPANLRALGAALLQVEARLFGIEEEDVPFVPDARTLASIEVLTLSTLLGKLDILSRPAGAPPYAELRRHAEPITVGSFVVRVAGLDHLIAMKRAAGRTKDRADIEELEAIADLRRRQG